MAGGRRWTEEETRQALDLYRHTPFGQIDESNPEVVALAKANGRTPASIAMKLANFASLDPEITKTGRTGLSGASVLDRKVWADRNG